MNPDFVKSVTNFQSLLEDQNLDAKLRRIAKAKFKILSNWIKNPIVDSRAAAQAEWDGRSQTLTLLSWTIFGIGTASSGLDTPPDLIAFSARSGSGGSYQRGFIGDHRLMIKVKPQSSRAWAYGPTTLTKEGVEKFISHLGPRSIISQDFVHEYVHHLDHIRTDDNIEHGFRSTDDTDVNSYFSSPVEFNAYYQQIAFAVEETIRKRIQELRDPGKTKRGRAVDFVNAFPLSASEFIDNLKTDAVQPIKKTFGINPVNAGRFFKAIQGDPKRWRNLQKRLAVLHAMLLKKYKILGIKRRLNP